MDKTLSIELEFTFNASQEKVWEALTSPTLIKQYFFGTDLSCSWQVGAPITWRGEWDGTTYEDKGTVLAFEPNRYLRYNYWSSFSGKEDKPENYFEISNALRQENGQTILTITQDGLENEEKRAHSEHNWQAVMAEMAKIL